MELRRVAAIVRKDAAGGPRSPFFLWVLVMPVFLTLVIQGVSGRLVERPPTIAVLAPEGSAVAAALAAREGVAVVRARDEAGLWQAVEAGEVTMGWALPPGFEEALRRGERPLAEIQLSGASLASERLLCGLAAVEALRAAEGATAPVRVEVAQAGAVGRPLSERLMPLVVLLSILLTGLFLPALSLIDERQKGMLAAIFVTPTTTAELLAAKGLMGATLAVASACVTLALCGAFPRDPGAILVVFALAGVMVAELGLILGSLARTTTAMFTVWKGTAWILALPVLGFLWAGAPAWLGPISPTHWFISPVWRIAVVGEGLGEVAGELGVALVWIAGLGPVVAWAGRRARRTIGEG